ncbi:MAG: GNAT family N-acetyltransferase [Candidatus Eisenbacteria bacterium]|nr:GNAT family N-acetyltransferase [Candidatus Eisenbacteria bacterium]MBU1950165.1 GNAT family N-acetyltransferase [Candidatus Eisenbacteria bacterium]
MTWSRRIDDRSWDDWLIHQDEATIFHSRLWARVLKAAFPKLGDRSLCRGINDPSAVFPLYAWTRAAGLVTHLHSSFPFLYGGPVPWPEGSPHQWIDLIPGRGVSAWILSNPFAGPSRKSPEPVPAGWTLSWDRTHILTLPETVDEFWDGILTTQKRNDIRRLTRKGVEIDSSTEPKDIETVYQLYLQRVRSWKERPGMIYPREYFSAMAAVGGESIRLYRVRFEGRLIGGTFVARWGGKVHYIAGYFDHEARKLRPNVLVQNRIIHDAIQDGFRIYDMLPSAGLRNVEVFKESFGSKPVPFWKLEKEGSLQRWARGIRKFGRRAPEKKD